MICQHCKNEVEPGRDGYCPKCGRKLIEPFEMDEDSGGKKSSENESRNKILILICTLAVIVIAVAGIMIINYQPAGKTDSANEQSAKPSEQETSKEQETNKEQEQFVIFDDAVLEKAIRDEIGVYNRDITLEEAKQYKTLYLSREKGDEDRIKSLKALSYFSNLKELDLSGTQIENLLYLDSLASLEKLYIGRNKISDLSPLENLNNLTVLDLEDNEVSDISSLKRLTNLESLMIGKNRISDISALQQLRKLKRLIICFNDIEDISALEGLSELSYLEIQENPIRDYSPVDSLPDDCVVVKALPISVPEEYYSFNSHTYAIYDAAKYRMKTYDQVSDFCHDQGGHLAVMNDEEENQFLYNLAVQKYEYTTVFFGYTDKDEEGTWVWDGDDSDYTNWTRSGDWNLPDNGADWGGDEDFAEFNYDKYPKYGQPNDGTWNDAGFMENTTLFICEWEYDMKNVQK